jgi:hypothetical protein
MNGWKFALRRTTAGLFVVLGGVIAGRGVLEAAPLSFIAMGLLMLALGVYRIRLMSWSGREES